MKQPLYGRVKEEWHLHRVWANSWTNSNVNLSDSGAEALSSSVGRSLARPGLLNAHGAWSSGLLRGLARLQGLRAAACMAHV